MKRLLFLLLTLLAACGPTVVTQATLNQEKANIEWAKKELAAAKASGKPMMKYIDALESGSLPAGDYLMITPGDILEWGKKAFLPYSFPAKSIHKKITGTLTTKEIKWVQIRPGNKLEMQIFVKGKDIQVHYKGDLYKPHLKKIKAGIEAGMTLNITVSLQLKGGQLVAHARCTAVSLSKNNDGIYTSNIEGAVNKALSKDSWKIALPAPQGTKPTGLLTTENHILIQFN